MPDLWFADCQDCQWSSGYERGPHAAAEAGEQHCDVWHDHRVHVEPVGFDPWEQVE